jgi:hypothetical protein
MNSVIDQNHRYSGDVPTDLDAGEMTQQLYDQITICLQPKLGAALQWSRFKRDGPGGFSSTRGPTVSAMPRQPGAVLEIMQFRSLFKRPVNEP